MDSIEFMNSEAYLDLLILVCQTIFAISFGTIPSSSNTLCCYSMNPFPFRVITIVLILTRLLFLSMLESICNLTQTYAISTFSKLVPF